MKIRLSEPALFWMLAALVGLVQAFTINGAPDWFGDDYASYIHSAQALRGEGRYALSGYTANLAVDAGPAAYPPGLPLMLTLPMAFAGTDFNALCLLNAVAIGLFVRLFAAWLRPAVPLPIAAAAALLAGLSPFMLTYKNVVASELPCLALLFAWFLVDRRMISGERWTGAVLSGLLLGASVLTRLAVAPALLAGPVAEAIRRRRLSLPVLLVPVLAVAIAALGLRWASPELIRHYWANVGANAGGGLLPVALLKQLPGNLAALPGRISVLWSYAGQGVQPALPLWLDLPRKAATLLLLAGGLFGLVLQLRRQARAAEVFFLINLALLPLLPEIMAGPRLYLPLSVLLVGYALTAAGAWRQAWLAQGAVIAVLLVGSACSWIAIGRLPANPYTLDEPRAAAMLDWLRYVPARGEVVLTHRARAVVFFTERPATDWHQKSADTAFLTWAAARNAPLLLISIDQPEIRQIARQAGGGTDEAGLNKALDAWEERFFGENRERVETAFRNTRFRIYRLPPP